MNNLYKGKTKNILAWLPAVVFVLITLYCHAFDAKKRYFHISLTADTTPVKIDTVPVKKDSVLPINQLPNNVQQADTSIRDTSNYEIGISEINKPGKTDTIIDNIADTFAFKSSKDSMDAPVTYHADDSMVFDVPGKRMMLYGKTSHVKYIRQQLTAPLIVYDQKANLVEAYLQRDSTGKVIAFPMFEQEDFKSISDSIKFDLKTSKGITKGTYTQQGEMFVYGQKIKRIDASVFYASKARFTTCNLDTPHFAFVSNKIKFISKKMAFSGPVHPEVEGVPIPVILPFGIYPLAQGRHSGLIPPSFTANDQYGLALEGLGYYKILSPNWDAVIRGTIYSYGGWALSVNPRYFKKYHYTGNMNLSLQSTKIGFKGDPDYSVTKTTFIQWSHSADTKARPGVTFTANVNAGSSKFNENVPNSPQRNFTNQLSSSIIYSKVWKNKPFNISVGANHNQNTTQRLININFPDFAFNLNTLYPFRRKEAIGAYKWYENLGVALNTNVRGLTYFYDTLSAAFTQMSDNFKWGANHSIPITLALPSLGPLQVAPSVSFQERWYQEKFYLSWNEADKKLDTVIRRGFYTAADMSFALGLSTRIFGSYGFNKKSKIQAIRHEIRPTLSASVKPDFNSQNFYNVQIDSFGNIIQHNVFERGVFGAFSGQRFAGLNFGIDNNLQMKVRNKKDTSQDAVKKITLIDGFSLTGSYNFLADSFNLSNLNLSARSNLFEKINITASATFDPYLVNDQGRRIDKLVWTDKVATLGTLTNGSISLSSHFNGGDKTAPTQGGLINDPNNINSTGLTLDEYQQEALYMQNNPAEFADFSIPWSVDFSYSLLFSQHYQIIKGEVTRVKKLGQSVNFNNSINLTPKWKLGIQGSYNITQKELGVLSMYLSRDLHCWQMSINISPVGKYRFFTINISPKSPILRDFKLNRTRYFYDL